MDYDKFKETWLNEHALSIDDVYTKLYNCFHEIDSMLDEVSNPFSQEDLEAILVAKPGDNDKRVNAIKESAFEDNKPGIENTLKDLKKKIVEAYKYIKLLESLSGKPLNVIDSNKKSKGIVLRVPALNAAVDFSWLGIPQPEGSLYHLLQYSYNSYMKLLSVWADWIDTRTDEGLRKPRTDAEWKPMFVDAAGNAL